MIARVAEALREPERRVEEVVMQEEIVSQLRNGAALRSMEAQSGASLLPFDTDIAGQADSLLDYAELCFCISVKLWKVAIDAHEFQHNMQYDILYDTLCI